MTGIRSKQAEFLRGWGLEEKALSTHCRNFAGRTGVGSERERVGQSASAEEPAMIILGQSRRAQAGIIDNDGERDHLERTWKSQAEFEISNVTMTRCAFLNAKSAQNLTVPARSFG
jgi:hypothetical protein